MSDSNLAVIKELAEFGIVRSKSKTPVKPKERPQWDNSAVAELSNPPDELKYLKGKSVGYKRLSILAIDVATAEFQIRPINEVWVQHIKKNLISCPGSPVTRIPVLLDPDMIQHKENYKEEMLSDMKIYALGGNHLVRAIKLVLMEEPENDCYECLRKIDVEIFVGLSRDEALFIANWHNQRCETMLMTFQDKVQVARQQFLMGDKKWKENFVKIIGDLECKETTVAALSTVISVASYQPDDYKLVENLFDHYRQTENPGKSFPQNLFRSLQGITNKSVYLLRAEGTTGLKQAKIATEDKKRQSLQKYFVNETKWECWENARAIFPEACDRLMEIAVGTSSNNIPIDAVNITKECREQGEDINAVIAIDISITVNQEKLKSKNITNLINKYKKIIKMEIVKNFNKSTELTDEE